jgi:hypothetical protein
MGLKVPPVRLLMTSTTIPKIRGLSPSSPSLIHDNSDHVYEASQAVFMNCTALLPLEDDGRYRVLWKGWITENIPQLVGPISRGRPRRTRAKIQSTPDRSQNKPKHGREPSVGQKNGWRPRLLAGFQRTQLNLPQRNPGLSERSSGGIGGVRRGFGNANLKS